MSVFDAIVAALIFCVPIGAGAYAGHRTAKAEKRAAARRYGHRS